MTTPAKPGRPAKYATPMTPARRAAEYRERRDLAALQLDADNLEDVPDAILVDALKIRLATIASPVNELVGDGAKHAAAKIIRAICERHKIDLTDI